MYGQIVGDVEDTITDVHAIVRGEGGNGEDEMLEEGSGGGKPRHDKEEELIYIHLSEREGRRGRRYINGRGMEIEGKEEKYHEM